MPRYVPSLFPFPWPDELTCGDPYINWPSDQSVLSSDTIYTEVAVPESWIQIGEDGVSNKTKEAYSLVLTRIRNVGNKFTKFMPMYRNRTFETYDDNFFKKDRYYLEYLGPPSQSSSLECDEPYHMLEYPFGLHNTDQEPLLSRYYLAKYEGNDWLFHLYAGDLDKTFETASRPPLACSDCVQVCDPQGKHIDRKPHRWNKCNFEGYPEPEWFCPLVGAAPTPTPTPGSARGGEKRVDMGLVIGLPTGIMGGLLLVGLAVYLVPRLQRRIRDEGAIRL